MPFNSINLELPHSANMCCVMYEGHEGDPGTETFTRQAHNINTAFHSERWEQVRDQFRQGQQPDVCRACWSQEAQGETSARQGYTQELAELGVELNTNTPPHPRKVQWTFSNTCNYACRTCSLTYSSGWLNNTRQLAKLEPNVRGHQLKLDLYDKTQWDQDRYEELMSVMQDAVQLELTGGETLLAKNLIPMLAKLNPRVAIKITTNGSQAPTPELIEALRRFSNVCITFSIDAVTPLTFKYIRTGDWFQVQRSIEEWLQHRDWINFRSTVTISILNMYLLNDVFKHLDQLFGVTNVAHNWVHDPSFYAVGIAPNSIKQWIDERITYFKARKLVPYMWSGTHNQDLWQQFLTRTKYLDQMRDEPMQNYLPELYAQINRTQ